MDVSAFAKELGGGGHKNAAGAKVDLEFIRKLYAEEL
jgi:nanoRNase/pAp phosphatase (c-di-AMP/oligoRNAs hydrolase)